MQERPVVVVGAGLAGLACALRLHQAGRAVRILEAGDAPGGRVRSDLCEGFRLDRGFQVLTTSYPEARRLLDYGALRLGRFEPGAWVRLAGRFEPFVDPLRRPAALLGTLLSPVAPLADKARVWRLRRRVCAGRLEELLARPERSTEEALVAEGFSRATIERFFRPFLAGVFLERELGTSSRFFDFVLRMFARGDAALPAEGMEAIPRQLAGRLPAGVLRVRARVDDLQGTRVRVAGEVVEASAVVVATDADAAARLLPGLRTPGFHGTTCLAFAAPRPPLQRPLLVLDGEGRGPVNHLCVPSQVQPDYAPRGQALVSASLVGVPDDDDATLERGVRAQLRDWFGAAVDEWRLLAVQRIPNALPRQPPGSLEPPSRPVALGERRFVCGDHRDLASLHGALLSGRRAAEALLA